jgi:hypothetical protein
MSDRDNAIRIMDDGSGREIERYTTDSNLEMQLADRTLTIGRHTIEVDPGEERLASQLLQSLGRAVSSGAGSVEHHWESSDDDFSPEELEREGQRQQVITLSTRAAKASSFVTGLMIVFGIVSVIAGLVILLQLDPEQRVNDSNDLGVGIAIMVAGLVQMSVGLMLSLGIGAVAEYIRYKAEFDPID